MPENSPIAAESPPARILVFAPGQLGDTVITVPALWVLRENFPHAHITQLSVKFVGKNFVLSRAVLENSGLVDDFLIYEAVRGRLSRLRNSWHQLRLFARLRAGRFDTLAYFGQRLRRRRQVARDVRFFRMVGVRRVLGLRELQFLHDIDRTRKPLPAVNSEADSLLQRLAADGLTVPAIVNARADLNPTPTEIAAVDAWMAGEDLPANRPWIAVGPGSKMPAKIWPIERVRTVVRALIAEFGVWPIVVGGPEDRALADALIAAWQAGSNAAGRLGPRADTVLMGRCKLFLGNDTGSMHLAAAAGIRCVAIFSARQFPGQWNPVGAGHFVLREAVPCEGCFLEVCDEHGNECLTRISVDAVLDACRQILAPAR